VAADISAGRRYRVAAAGDIAQRCSAAIVATVSDRIRCAL